MQIKKSEKVCLGISSHKPSPKGSFCIILLFAFMAIQVLMCHKLQSSKQLICLKQNARLLLDKECGQNSVPFLGLLQSDLVPSLQQYKSLPSPLPLSFVGVTICFLVQKRLEQVQPFISILPTD